MRTVLNVHPPPDVKAYVHRVGRTGRAGQAGTALTLLSPGDAALASQIEDALSGDRLRNEIRQRKAACRSGIALTLLSPGDAALACQIKDGGFSCRHFAARLATPNLLAVGMFASRLFLCNRPAEVQHHRWAVPQRIVAFDYLRMRLWRCSSPSPNGAQIQTNTEHKQNKTCATQRGGRLPPCTTTRRRRPATLQAARRRVRSWC